MPSFSMIIYSGIFVHIVIGTKLSNFLLVLTFLECTFSIVFFMIYLTSGSIHTLDLIKESHKLELLLFLFVSLTILELGTPYYVDNTNYHVGNSF